MSVQIFELLLQEASGEKKSKKSDSSMNTHVEPLDASLCTHNCLSAYPQTWLDFCSSLLGLNGKNESSNNNLRWQHWKVNPGLQEERSQSDQRHWGGTCCQLRVSGSWVLTKFSENWLIVHVKMAINAVFSLTNLQIFFFSLFYIMLNRCSLSFGLTKQDI